MSAPAEKAPRVCSHCGAGMWAGYVINGGEFYYCADACLHAHVTPEEYADLYADGEGDSYWSEWNADDCDDDGKEPGVLVLRIGYEPADGYTEAEARADLAEDLSLLFQSLADGGALPESVESILNLGIKGA